MLPEDRLDAILVRAKELQEEMNAKISPERLVALSKEYAELEPRAQIIETYRKVRAEIEDLRGITETDDAEIELRELALEELPANEARLLDIEKQIGVMLLPTDSADMLNVILEVRAGTGGDEAALFAGDLFRMYHRFSELNGWKVEPISQSEGDVGGYKEVICAIRGRGVFSKLKFESGVHRVQRVPETESSGRVHTSAATVAVLPEPEDVDIEIQDKDIRVDVFRASGPGGQSVNTTDSAVRITHLPSGIVVIQQDEKSQHKNRAKAMQVLRARLFEAKRMEMDADRAADRKLQVGSGDRSERIRTYNFSQGRVSDHRINLTLHKLDKILNGDGLEELIAALTGEEETRRLAQAR